MDKRTNNLAVAIISAWLVVGTLDLASAIIQTLVMGGNPLGMLQYISSGIAGQDAFAGGIKYSLLGVLIHYAIAFSWTILFFLLYPGIKGLSTHKLLTGIAYGVIVWLVMNRVVVPLSKIPARPFNLKNALIGLGILVIAIGIPLSLMASKYYTSKVIKR
jgi:uncharacterized membrane protein YagU involved in acid resistance